MAFRYQAIDAGGRTVVDTIDAGSTREAADRLRERGLFVTRIDATQEEAPNAPLTAQAQAKARARLSDVVLFTQQMSMLLRAGARVVQALEAIENQTHRASWRGVIHRVRDEVEEGRPLSDALGQFPRIFSGVYLSMISAGEASGEMGLAFERLGILTRQQADIRNKVIGALTYPCILVLLCVNVVLTMVLFILPRFAEMFKVLEVELPLSTQLLIETSEWLQVHWPLALGASVGAVAGVTAWLRSAQGRRTVSWASVRVPLFGRVVRSVTLARLCRIWGQLLQSQVGLIDAVRLTRQSTHSLDYRALFDDLEQAITEGEAVGPPLRRSWLLPKTFAAAIATGEESGKLGDSLLFVATCMEEDNAQILASLSRLIEPLMLVVMGVVVGGMAFSLFLPMFDMATAGG